MAESRVTLRLELNAESISAAVGIYIQYKVRQLTELKKYNKETRYAVLDHLSSNADNTFLWVTLVCQSLKEVPRWKTLTKLNAFPPGLDALYSRMIEQICTSDDAELCKKVLTLVATVYRPISLLEMTSLAETLEDMVDDSDSLKEIIGLCGSMLTIREDTVYFVHQSVKDYLLEQAFDKIFPSGKEDMHKTIVSRSLHVLSKKLKRDIYEVHALGCDIKEIKKPDPDPLAPLRYSCTYWVDHFCDCYANENIISQVEGEIEQFLKTKYLFWLEALSLCRNMSQGVRSMTKLEALIQKRRGKFSAMDFIRDARRFIMYHKQAIENSPLQAYVSALKFSPSESLVRALFMEEEPNWVSVKPSMSEKWSACLQTLEGHMNTVILVAFSRDMKWLASASSDGTIKIWDPHDGQCLRTLKGHDEIISSMIISHDSIWIASGSYDGKIKIWEVCSGSCLYTFVAHSSEVVSIAFSHDSAWLASTSTGLIKIWDTRSGQFLRTLDDYGNYRWLISFSHDSAWLASARTRDSRYLFSLDCDIQIFDSFNGQLLRSFKDHSNFISSFKFSHDSTRLVSASFDKTIKIWDTGNGSCLQSLECHGSLAESVAFSHDSTFLASGLGNGTVMIWNSYNGQFLQKFEGHSDTPTSISFSSDSKWLASSSRDQTIKIWDTYHKLNQPLHEGHDIMIHEVAISCNSLWLATSSLDGTVKIWDISSGKCLQTLEVDYIINAISISHNSRWVALGDETVVKIWDIFHEKYVQILDGHEDELVSIAFSHDSILLASGSLDASIRIWDTRNGNCLQTLEIGQTVEVISFDPTGSYIHTGYGTICIDGPSSQIMIPNSQNIRYQGWTISDDYMWITYNSENLVYIPSEYRPSKRMSGGCEGTWAVSSNIICVGTGSGKVWIFTFKDKNF